MLHALRSQSPARSIYNGEIYVICNLAHTELCCTKQEIVALRPFRVKQIGHEETCSRESSEPQEKRSFFGFKSQTMKAAERAEMKADDAERWAKDIRECVRRIALRTEPPDRNNIKAIVLFGEKWNPDRHAEIEQDYPGVEIIVCRSDLDFRSKLLRVAVMNQLGN